MLRTYKPRKYKLSLFDEQLGRIECSIPFKKKTILDRVSAGAMVQYYIKPLQTLYELHDVELIAMPSAYARHDIYFLHQVLELLYYFLPPELPSPELFTLFGLLFEPPAELYTNAGKKMVLLKFFSVLGSFPEETPVFDPKIYRLISLSIESMLKENLSAPLEVEVDHLILACIGAHPYKKQFKTIYTISRMDQNDSNKP